jgi:hypothetical protein
MIARVAATPASRGICRSISTTSGRSRGVDGLLAVRRLADNGDIGFGVQDHGQPAPDQRLIVDDQDPDAAVGVSVRG